MGDAYLRAGPAAGKVMSRRSGLTIHAVETHSFEEAHYTKVINEKKLKLPCAPGGACLFCFCLFISDRHSPIS